MENEKRRYTPDEILEVFKEEHRLCSQLDSMADPTYVLTKDTLIWEWQDAGDLLSWPELAGYYNSRYKIDIPLATWQNAFVPDDEKTLGDLCNLIARYADKEIIKLTTILGAESLAAAVFLTLKKNLKNKGVDVTNLSPSTEVGPFLTAHFPELIEEITSSGVKTFDTLALSPLQVERINKFWFDKFLPRFKLKRHLITGNIQTFRDLCERIAEGLNENQIPTPPRFGVVPSSA